MRTALAVALAFGVALTAVPVSAAPVEAPAITVTANVGDTFSIVVDLRRDIPTFPEMSDTAMVFDLVDNTGTDPVTGLPLGDLVAEEGVVAFINVINNSGTGFTISSTITNPLTRTGGSETIPNGAFVINVAEDGLGAPGYTGNTAIGDHVIYTSEAAGVGSQVEAHYYITSDTGLGSSASVPPSQLAGAYTTTLIISATRV